MNPNIEFRPYQRADLPACASIGAEVFPLLSCRFTHKEATEIMKVHIDSCHAISSYHELAIADGKVAGLLFGQVKRKSVLRNACQTWKRLLLMVGRFLLGRYRSRRELIRLIKPCLQELKALRRNMPASEAMVTLFAVVPEYQGIGIGRALMNRFVHHVSTYKAKAISVPTDETASFWFYERCGFKRWAEYNDPLESYLAHRPIRGFLYRLVLNGTTEQELARALTNNANQP